MENRTRKGNEENRRRNQKNKQPDTHPEEEDTNEYYDCVYAPYIEGFSERLQKDLKSLKVGVAFKTTKTLF